MSIITKFDIDCLEKLFQAIVAVDERYIKYGSFSEELKDFETENPLERVFTYELYHQWRKLIEGEKDLVLNGEIIKCTSNSKKYYPDFVLHGGQENCEYQEIVCEVKRFCSLSQSNMIQDLQKLLIFTDSENADATFNHPFKFGVFIVIGCELKTILKMLDGTAENYNEIICIARSQAHELQYKKIGQAGKGKSYTAETNWNNVIENININVSNK